ncbi:hypothetical protein E2C01_003920 [Portunus trituberculatus]|uniref:Uncharacterized protein n=1 Tax=Portunus trituberculatus TaxID=210409 RepID=A0A5B7CQ14_PORTR|nr:hypothetical protein [Portunus trituberculatus]
METEIHQTAKSFSAGPSTAQTHKKLLCWAQHSTNAQDAKHRTSNSHNSKGKISTDLTAESNALFSSCTTTTTTTTSRRAGEELSSVLPHEECPRDVHIEGAHNAILGDLYTGL